MTYKETEFPQILEILAEYSKKGFPLEEIIMNLYKLYKDVPIYIGIVAMCLENLVKETKEKDIRKGDFIFLFDKNFIYQGEVKKIEMPNNIYLKNVKVIANKKNLKMKLKKQKLFKLEKNVLVKLWPSLYFKK